MAVEALSTQSQQVTGKLDSDCISRQAAIDVATYDSLIISAMDSVKDGDIHRTKRAIARLLASLPPAQPEITDGQAIKHLQDSGWMKNHDKQMYEMGLREQLADDSDSYNALLPSAQPERKIGKWKHLGGDEWCCNQCGNVIHTEGHWEHPLSNDRKMYHCNICGADMRGEDDADNSQI